VRLVQRFGRVDRIGTEHSVIHLHNMWPDLEVDERLALTERLLHRIQMFHDFIGLDSHLLSATERLNSNAMYRIYQEKKLPDTDDGLDDVAAHQRGIALLQRIQAEDPDLWETIANLPDGIRSALQIAEPESATTQAERYMQNVLEIEGGQMPMMSPGQQADVESPFDDPKPGETIALLSSDGVTRSYAVGDALEPRAISPAQLIAATKCEPDTPAAPLPENTNGRVMAAFDSFKSESQRTLGRARRPTTDTRVRRYLSRQLSIAREQHKNDPDELRRIEVLRRIFLDHLPDRVVGALRDIRDLRLEGDVLVRRLEGLRHLYRLNPPDEDETPAAPSAEVIRIVCSDGFVG